LFGLEETRNIFYARTFNQEFRQSLPDPEVWRTILVPSVVVEDDKDPAKPLENLKGWLLAHSHQIDELSWLNWVHACDLASDTAVRKRVFHYRSDHRDKVAELANQIWLAARE
jgi:hypothetical protein